MVEKENLIKTINKLRTTLERNLAEGFSGSSYFDINHDIETAKNALKAYNTSKSKECLEKKEELTVDMENLIKTINEISIQEIDDNSCSLLADKLEQCSISMANYFELLYSIETEKEELTGV